MEIRPATIDDAPIVAEFNIAMALETEDLKLDQKTVILGVQHLIEHDELGFYLVAVLEGKVVGTLLVTTEWSDWRNGVFWWIQSVYVHPSFRRQGIYRSLYEHVRNLASSTNVCGFRLYVEKENRAAQQTYEKLGMHETHYRMYEQKS